MAARDCSGGETRHQSEVDLQSGYRFCLMNLPAFEVNLLTSSAPDVLHSTLRDG
jgi:hypothetical protein